MPVAKPLATLTLSLVDAMDEFVYNSVSKYFHALSVMGYIKQKSVNSLLVLLFYYHLIYHDYRGYISREDYHDIEKALNCLYGTNCLIPYPDYLKMGKLRLGEMTELASRVRTLENTEVIKTFKSKATANHHDVILVESDDSE